MGELVGAEVTEVAGPKGRHDPNRTACRHGSQDGKVTLGGRRIPVRRPRVRAIADDAGSEREVRLESYDTFASVDLLADHMIASMLAGLSGRRYHSALEPVGETVEASASGTSQSSVSRRFITASGWPSSAPGPLDDQRWLIVFVDAQRRLRRHRHRQGPLQLLAADHGHPAGRHRRKPRHRGRPELDAAGADPTGPRPRLRAQRRGRSRRPSPATDPREPSEFQHLQPDPARRQPMR